MAAINGFMNVVKMVKVTRLSFCLGLFLMRASPPLLLRLN